MVISVPFIAGEMLEAFSEFTNTDAELPEFQQEVTYRRFVFGQNPISGDLDMSNYSDYIIYVTLDVSTRGDNDLVLAGVLEQGDSDIFMPARIRRNTDGSFIENEFRPQIGDYVIYKNVTYRLDELSFNRMGETEIFCRAKGKRMKDEDTDPEEITSAPYVAGELLDIYKEFASDPTFQQSVTYRNFTESHNPITGDLDKGVYTDYTIYVTLDLLDTENKLVQAGELQEGDAIVWMSSRISVETDGTEVSPQVKPKPRDFIIFNDITYRIAGLDFPIMGDTETFAKLTCQRMKDESSVSDVTTVPYVAGEILDLFYEYITTPEFQQKMTYRNFTQTTTPISGDLNLATYSDYSIYGTLDVEGIEKTLLPAGSLINSDVTIWLQARLKTETDGTAISPQIRPTINDRIIYDGVTYRINKITFYMMGTNEMFAKINGLRLSSANPTTDWNASYNSKYAVGKGYS